VTELPAEATDLLTTSQKSATEVHYTHLGHMSEKEVSTSNKIACQTPAVLRQAAYERRRGEHLHENAVFELEIAQECQEASTPGVRISGYMQQLGIHPFHVLFYSEERIAAHTAQCKSALGVTVHVDATGSVVSCISGQKSTYYYCVLLADSNLPVLDILSSCHETAWIYGMLLSYNSFVRRVNNGRLVTRRYDVTDFSYALMHAFIQAFNEGTQLHAGTDEQRDVPVSVPHTCCMSE